MKVFKYELLDTTVQAVEFPIGWKLLHVGQQHGVICLWVLVNPEADLRSVPIRIVGTGHEISNSHCGTFLGTVLLHDGDLVLHVFASMKS